VRASFLTACGKPETLIPLCLSPTSFVPYEKAGVHSSVRRARDGLCILWRVMKGESFARFRRPGETREGLIGEKIEGR